MTAGLVSVFLGDGAGGFGNPTAFATAWGAFSVAIGDLNGDSRVDLAVANSGAGSVSVLLGNGGGSFAAAVQHSTGVYPVSIAIGDLNGDSKLDLGTANLQSNDASILLGDGAGGFGASTSLATGLAPYSVAFADWNGDARLDLATANSYTMSVSLFLGSVSGLQDGPKFAALGTPLDVTGGDWNGDGRMDLAAVGPEVSLLVNACPSVCVPATVATFGSGKPGSSGVPRLESHAPKLGSTTTITLTNAVAGPGVLFGGLQHVAIPFDGGTLLVAPFATVSIVVPPAGGLLIPAAIPADGALCGLDLYFQAFILDPAAAGFYHTAQTAGLHWEFGL